jgi:succinate-acetate transporter protein
MTSQTRTGQAGTDTEAIYPHEGRGGGASRVQERPDLADGHYGEGPGDHVAADRRRRRGADAVDTEAQAGSPSIADPGPLGLGAFALTTFVLSVFNAKIITDAKLEAVVLPVALFYGGLAQLLAGMWEFKKGNTFGATAFTSFGAFWLSYAAYAKFVLPNIENQPDAYKATGLFLLAWTIFAAIMFTAAVRVSGALALVFLTATAAFALLTIGTLGQDPSITKLGGIAGLAAAGAAWYTSWAGLLNDAWKRTVLPIFAVKSSH